MVAKAVKTQPVQPEWAAELDLALTDLDARKDDWAQTSNGERIALLRQVKDHVREVAGAWVKTATRKKGIPTGSPLEGEEWLAGPAALMDGCNQFIHTLSLMEGKKFLDSLPVRTLPNGQVAVTVVPNSLWDKVLFTGLKAEIWMQPGVTKANLAANTASAYDAPRTSRKGKIGLVLGAGNVASIAPLDCLHKLLVEHQVVLLKMNPVNDYLIDFLRPALRPLIEFGALRIVRGGADVGAYLCNHDLVDDIHITGAAASHDAIVWGPGEEGRKNKAAGTPRNSRRITSELGGVAPTIVVPGPWSDADITYHAELIATQKLNNSGFNCIACQMLVLPEGWGKSDALLAALEKVMQKAPSRPAYYPGATERLAAFEAHADSVQKFERPGGPACVVVPFRPGTDTYLENAEVFAPALSVMRLPAGNAESYLRAAVAYANEKLHGTLAANILIHPRTIAEIGRQRFEEIIAELRYGGIGINSWSGVLFALLRPTWGAFLGHTLDDVQSGIGVVHNTYLFDRPERSVLEAPFRIMPKPAWFLTHKRAHMVGRLITEFNYQPSLLKLPRIIWNALRG
ncbi:aldehyde dehydrogenase family protein [Mesorhizobium sp. M0478]|uniref:aldehyde dehydrogenase family protein n=1 Tax=Mesorhizobium sp. M0478 TaxID=2956947 RepID=UPI003337B749